MTSAFAGSGKPVFGPAITSIWSTLDRAGEIVFRLARGKIFEAGDEQRRVHAVDHRHWTGLASVPILLRDDGTVAALVVELHGDLVPRVHLHAIDRSVDPTSVRIAHDHDRAGNIGSTVFTVPNRRRQLAKVHGIAAHAVLQERRILHGHRLVELQRVPLRHPGLQRVERTQIRIESQRQRRALRIGGGVGEDAESGGITLDAVEQQRRTFRQSGRDLGDAANLDIWVGVRDMPQRAELLHLGDEFAQILVHLKEPHSGDAAIVS